MSNQAESMMQDQIEGAQSENDRLREELHRLRDALRDVPTELIACLIDARDDVAAELQRCREAAGYPSTDRRLAAQEALLERVDAAIAAATPQQPAQPVKRLTDEQIRKLGNNLPMEHRFHSRAFARAIETACAAAWGVKLEEPA